MKILIIEDEPAVADNLKTILNEIDPGFSILKIIDNIEDAVKWISNNPPPDLAFFDIHLSDGSSFEIFNSVDVNFPLIFTTAFDEYAIEAFKFNSIGYILKPINKSDIQNAIDKFNRLKNSFHYSQSTLNRLIESSQKNYKQTILVQNNKKYIPVSVTDFTLFSIKNELVYGYTAENNKYLLDLNLESLDSSLDPAQFFRVNRQQIIARKAIKEIEYFIKGKLAVGLFKNPGEQIIISKGRVPQFKKWLDN